MSGLLFGITVTAVAAIALVLAAASGLLLAIGPARLRDPARVHLRAAGASFLVALCTWALAELLNVSDELLDRIAFPWCWALGIAWVVVVWFKAGRPSALLLGLLFLSLGFFVYVNNR